jgi:hypothetical protein
VIGAALVALATRVWLVAAPPSTGPLGPVDQDPDAVREQACRIVSSNRRVCSPATTNPPKADGGNSGNFDLSILSLLLWILLIAAALGLLVLLVRAVAARSGGGRSSRDRSAGDDDDDLDVVQRDAVSVDRSREPTNWRAEAEEHRRSGRYREALRCRYRALVGDLARRGLIDEIPGRTTGEERAQLRRVRPGASPPFNAAADLFDGAWYGNFDVGLGDDDEFQMLERDILAAAGDRR